MTRNPRVFGVSFRVLTVGSALLALGWSDCFSEAHGRAMSTESTWLRPVAGSFLDPSRWSAGVPGPSDVGFFGPAVAVAPYAVTVDTGLITGGLVVANQRPLLALDPGVVLTTMQGVTVGGMTDGSFDATSLDIEVGSLQVTGKTSVGCDGTRGLMRLTGSSSVVGSLAIGCEQGVGEVWVRGNENANGGIYLVGAGSTADPSILIGAGGVGTCDLREDVVSGFGGSLLALPSNVWCVGANGGTGVLSMRGGNHTPAGTMRFGGDGPGPRGPGEGVWLLEDCMVIGPNASATVGSEGFGALQLAGSVTLSLPSLAIGADGGWGVVEVVGMADLPSMTLGSPGSSGSIVVSGPSTVADAGTVTVNGGEGAIRVLNGALLQGTIEFQGATASIELLGHDSAIYATRLERMASADTGVLACSIGDGSTLTVDFLRSPPTSDGLPGMMLKVADGGTLDVFQFQTVSGGMPSYELELAPSSTFKADIWQSATSSRIRLHGANGTLPDIDVETCALKGTLSIVIDDEWIPDGGTILTLIAAEHLSDELSSYELPSWHGYPPIVESDDSSLRLHVIDHADELIVPQPGDVWVGLERPISVLVAIDGETMDITRQAEWEFDESMIALVGSDRLIGLQAGRTTAVVRFGPMEREITLTVRDDASAIPFTLVNTIDGEWIADPESLGSGFAERGSHLSFDGSSAVFASLSAPLAPPGTQLPAVLVKDPNGDDLTFVAAIASFHEYDSFAPRQSISSDGRFLAFVTPDALVSDPAAQGWLEKVYVFDRQTQTMELASGGLNGLSADRDCGEPLVSGDGRWVFFVSTATNLVPGEREALAIYRHDRWTGATSLVTADESGGALSHVDSLMSITPDARYVCFTRYTVGHGYLLVWRKDLLTGELALGSVPPDLSRPWVWVDSADMSADGRFIAFVAETSVPLVPGAETPAGEQLYVRDMVEGTTSLLSLDDDGEPFGAGVVDLAMDDAGRFVVMTTSEANVAGGDPAGPDRIRALRLDRLTSEITAVSVGVVGPFNDHVDNVDISGDGLSVLLSTEASNVLPGDVPSTADIFVRHYARPVVGDLDGDGQVTASDLAVLLGSWGANGVGIAADLNDDGIVNQLDLAVLLGVWS
ncbi:MAG: hypothetical protein JNL80_08210 [Phycisphaerae bacterium]|nr:hypothetical protein [Phycisphaerae bacterium]